jgi:methyl-accepting chemotaxis protein
MPPVMLAVATATPKTATLIAARLTDRECDPPAIAATASLDAVFDLFERHADLRLLPIVDEDGRPCGAIYDGDVRRLLLNPFGRALRQNPAYRGSIAELSRPVPIADIGSGLTDVVDRYRRDGGTEGMILTREGRLYAVVSNARLIALSAEHDVARERGLAAKGQAIEQASRTFERQVANLIDELQTMARAVKLQAEAAATSSAQTGDHAASVAAGALQGTHNLVAVETHGATLGAAFAAIADSTHDAKALAADAVELVRTGTERAENLARMAGSIEDVVQLIGGISRQVSLLALNAGIEAARAGEAGRGFAVVAHEVKALSHQTASAADRVVHHIADIQAAVAAAAQGHRAVAGMIADIDARSGAIETAMAGQATSAVTIARNVGEAARAAAMVQTDADAIAGNARIAADNAVTMRDLATRFLDGADRLAAETSRFLTEIGTG